MTMAAPELCGPPTCVAMARMSEIITTVMPDNCDLLKRLAPRIDKLESARPVRICKKIRMAYDVCVKTKALRMAPV